MSEEAPVEVVQQAELPLAEGVDTTRQNNVEQAPTAQPEAKPEAVKEEVTPEQAVERDRKKEGARYGRKLDKAYRERAEAQARAEFLAKELETARQAQAPKVVDGEPTLAQFDYDPEKYAAAKAEFAKTQASKEFESKQKTEAQKQAQQKLLASWEEKAERGAEKYDDWMDKVGVLQPTIPAFAALMEADNAEDIAHYLGSNPKEAQRIIQLPPLSQVREIGKIEATLLATAPKAAAPSKAPAPIVPLKGTGNASSTEPSEEDSMKDWLAKRQKQVHGKRR